LSNPLGVVGGYPEALRAFEDLYLWLLREQRPFAYVHEKLAVWRFAHFPVSLQVPRRAKSTEPIFCQMVSCAIWGRSGRTRAVARAPRSILGYIGLDALADGDRATARSAFMHAISLDPYRVRNYMR